MKSALLRSLMGGVSAPVDPYFKNVALLLHGDGSNGAQNNTFVDSGPNNLAVARNGNATQGSFSPYGSNWSNYFDGNDYISAPSAAGALGTGDFTIECWYKSDVTTAATHCPIIAQYESNAQGSWAIKASAGSNQCLEFAYYNSGWVDNTTSTNITSDRAWHHVAVTRSGTTLRIYADGVLLRTDSISSGVSLGNTGYTLQIGRIANDNAYMTGYVSNARIIAGTALYTGATYTVPTSPLAAISGTVFLGCQSNRFRDASSNNFTITRNGEAKVVPYSPFAPNAAYSNSNNNGSAYLDGNGDNLIVSSSTALGFGTGDFTLEFWFYHAGNSVSYDTRYVTFGDNSGSLNITDRNGIGIVNEAVSHIIENTGVSFDIGAWNHLAFTRSGSTLRLFKNGVQFATATSSAGNSTGILGVYGGSSTLACYFADIRVVKGTAVYTSNFTPPTVPLAAIDGTSVLLKFTNAGIYDHAMQNVFETIDNVRVSTSVKKYGTGSMYFDGSGDYLLRSGLKTDMKWMHGGGEDWTAEWWMYPSSSSEMGILCTNTNSTGGAHGFVIGHSIMGDPGCIGGHFTRGVDGARMDWYTSGGVIATNAWTHVAVMFNKTTKNISVYINGTSVSVANRNMEGNSWTGGDGSAFAYSSSDPTHNLNIGRVAGTVTFGLHFNGYIDDIRITRGLRRYTSNFTVPDKAFPNQ